MTTPWVTFCISTYKRPSLLEIQLRRLISQLEPDFVVVVSDNDPEGSGKIAVSNVADSRIQYFKNDQNLGMVKSFNASLTRAATDFVVMVTDDDPIVPHFLSFFKPLIEQNPGFSLYGGFGRAGISPKSIEKFVGAEVPNELLDPKKTNYILWSGCILNREIALKVGGMADYGSPHLADHALLAKVGALNGALIVNELFSHVEFHENNFSKLNFSAYLVGCRGFMESMSTFCEEHNYDCRKVVQTHLDSWFISNFFNLKKYYIKRRDGENLASLKNYAMQILALPFMKHLRFKYKAKTLILNVKLRLGLLK